jgi:DNA replication protein DnaC
VKIGEPVILAPDEAKLCPGCGELMAEGSRMTLPGNREVIVYAHESRCLEFQRLERRRELALTRRSLALQYLNGPALPRATVDGGTKTVIDSLAVYRQCFPETTGDGGTHHRSVLVAERFLAAVADRRIPNSGFILAGQVGVGKSTLMNAFARDLIRSYVGASLYTGGRCPVVWWKEQALWEHVTGQMDKPGREQEDLLGPLIHAPILIIDNLGGQDPSPWWIDTVLFNVVDERYQAGKPILATTKYSLERLKARWRVSSHGRTASCTEDLIDRLQHRCMELLILGGTHRKTKVDF